METLLIVAVVIASGLMLYSKLVFLEQRVRRQEIMITQLMKQAQVEVPVPDKIVGLIRQGKEVQAIKAAREEFGYSLLEAKEYVDAVKIGVE